MTQDRHEHLMLKFLSGSMSPEERQELRLWLDESPENQRELEEYRKVWALGSLPAARPDFQTQEEWEKLEAAIEQEHASLRRQKTVPFRKTPLPAIAATIAFLLICVLSLYLFTLNEDRGLIVQESAEQPIDFVLPDGSQVWLNRRSKLSYPQNFNEEDRRVELMGEAFFEVEKNPARPFVIHADGAAIKVLGTSFNVKAFAQTAQTAVYVLSGKVSLSAIGHQEQEVLLSPGQTGFLHKTDLSLSLQKEDASNVLAWKDKKLIFKKTELRQVLKTLEEYFEVKISVSNPALLTCRFSSSFQDPELEEVLDVLRISLNLSIRKEGKSLTLDGDGCK